MDTASDPGDNPNSEFETFLKATFMENLRKYKTKKDNGLSQLQASDKTQALASPSRQAWLCPQ